MARRDLSLAAIRAMAKIPDTVAVVAAAVHGPKRAYPYGAAFVLVANTAPAVVPVPIWIVEIDICAIAIDTTDKRYGEAWHVAQCARYAVARGPGLEAAIDTLRTLRADPSPRGSRARLAFDSDEEIADACVQAWAEMEASR